eukprot:TRINITY_DN75884_c0_g1_i1.p1 TRINITY_DN75884_c0_g1~~TRINITY_DN75884_c0_g1_i1.p1  ORF type:complete len:488 (-),score=84.58 TRINITY_DN75884_c0_g1_i1:128-1591(-)
MSYSVPPIWIKLSIFNLAAPVLRAVLDRKMRLPGLPKCRPEDVGLASGALCQHTQANKRQLEKRYMLGVAECAIQDNQLVYVDVQGHQDRELSVPMTERSLFRCYSMTKPITGMALMALWEDGKLSLDDPVHKYIPCFKNMKVRKGDIVEDARRHMTLRHLVTHTSGLGYGPSRYFKSENLGEGMYTDFVKRVDSGSIPDLSCFCEELSKLPLRFHPGERWEYSMGLDVLGRVLEIVSGVRLDRLLRDRVFKPIGMQDTAFWITPGKARRQLTAAYVTKGRVKNRKTKLFEKFQARRTDGRSPESSAWVRRNPRVLSGGGICGSMAGGLLSSLRDQALFCNVVVNMGFAHATGRQVLKPSTVQLMCKDWLRLKSVRARPTMPGWGMFSKGVGWCPLGHYMIQKRQMFMGGIATSWVIDLVTKTVQVTMSSSFSEDDPHGWDEKSDELDGAIKTARRTQLKEKQHAIPEKKRSPSCDGLKSPKRAKLC